MEVITDASKIDKALVSMMKKYKKYHIATAWASLGSKASDELLKNKAKIQKMVVGTHFYQTHPDFMEIFIESEQVKFILQTDGVYHPKVYIFSKTINGIILRRRTPHLYFKRSMWYPCRWKVWPMCLLR